MNIKLQAMLNGGRWIARTFGERELESLLATLPEALRDRYRSGIAINWHPAEEFIAFLSAAEERFGSGDGRVAERIGAAGAEANVSGSLARALFYVARPAFVMRRLAGVWRQYNDAGSMRVLEFGNTLMIVEVEGASPPSWLFCCTITGWATVIAHQFKADHPVVKHVECRAKGGKRCVWEGRWHGLLK